MTEGQIQVTVKFFAAPRETVGTDEVDLEIPTDSTISTLLTLLRERYPALAPYLSALSVAVNRRYVARQTELQADDEVALLPPVAGG
jgi:molybdopterin converting factor subunit 1